MENPETYIVLVKAFIRKGDKFLLAQRALTELQKPGAWSLPGGKVDFTGEYCADILLKTLKKEIKEEVGLEISDEVGFVWTNLFTRRDDRKVVNITFLAEYLAGEAAALDDTSSVRWVTLEELKNLEGMEDFLRSEVEHLDNFLSKKEFASKL